MAFFLKHLQYLLLKTSTFLLLFILLSIKGPAQVAGFLAPDTVCVNQPVTITNTTIGGTTWYWNFCSGNTLNNPLGQNIGNPGNLLNIPGYLTLVKDGNTCYSFITNQGSHTVVRYNHGSSFNNNPLSWTNLGSFGILGDTVQGIKICYDNGQWIGFVCANNRLARLNFGSSLANTPTATQLGPYTLLYTAHCIDIFQEGGVWLGFITNSWGNKMVFLNFGSSLMNPPTLTNMGTPGGLSMPASFRFVNENGLWYALVNNGGDSTTTRLFFGTSLFNTPVGENLGKVCPGINPGGIALIRDCENITGFQLNYSTTSPNLIWRLNFPAGITGSVTGTPLGNIGSLSRPSQFSEVFRVGDTLFLYNTNRQNFTLTRLRFLPCSSASVPSSTLYNPPVFSYSQPGTYNVQLMVNEGLPTQSSVCKSIVVIAGPCTSTASFTAPDTVCTGEPVVLTNNSTGGTSYYWNFCSGSSANTPIGENMGTLGGNLNWPVYSSLVKEGSDCFTFVTNQGTPTHLTRIYHGNNFRNAPVSVVSLLQTGVLDAYVEALQIVNDNGTWYGLVCNNNTILRLNFGLSLWNVNPTVTNLGPYTGISVAHGISIVKEGTTWLAFFNSHTVNKLFRLNFGNSLANTPVLTDFGNIAVFAHPVQIAAIRENGNCYLLMNNYDNNTLSRISFGNSYLNTPSGQNLGNCGGLDKPHGISLLNDCETSIGYYTTFRITPLGTIGRLTFSGGVGGTVSAQSVGNQGNLDNPCSFSEIFRENDSLFAFVLNQHNSTITRLSFPPCTNASAPSSTLFNPQPYSYNAPGVYRVRLVVDEGLFSESSLCKSIVAVPPPVVSLGADRIICPGTTTTLDAGSGFSSYLWSTGATSQTITVGSSGSYWVKVTKYSCFDSDTVNVSQYTVTPVNLGADQTVCQGDPVTFHAGPCTGCTYSWSNLSTGQPNIGTDSNFTTSIAGIYSVMVTSPGNCISYDTIQLFTHSTPQLDPLPALAPFCSGNQVVLPLSSETSNCSFSWTVTKSSPAVSGCLPGTGDTIRQTLYNASNVRQTVTYHITPFTGTCTGIPVDHTDTIKPLPGTTVSPSIQSVCHGESDSIHLSSTVSGSILSWTASAGSMLVTGYTSGSGNFIRDTLFNTSTATDTVTYAVVSTADGCTGNPMHSRVAVIPLPVAGVTPGAQTICSGSETSLVLASSVSSATFSWVAGVSSGSISGFSNGSGDTIRQFLTNPTPAPGSVQYLITALYAGCISPAIACTVMVNPVPGMSVSGNLSSICSGDLFTALFSSPTPGTTYAWSALATSPLVTGFQDGSGDSVRQILSNASASNQTVTYHIIPTANSCPGPVYPLDVQIKPLPDIQIVPVNQAVCFGQAAHIRLTSAFSGATFSWQASGSSPSVTGFYSGAGDSIDQTLYTTGDSSQTVTYMATSTHNGCTGSSIPSVVTTYPVPAVIITPPTQEICSEKFTGLILNSPLAGTTFSWTAGGTANVSGYGSGAGASVIQRLFNNSNTSGTVTYQITPAIFQCPGAVHPVPVTINPRPVVHLRLCSDTITTLAAQPFLLRGGSPQGGAWAGPGVSASGGWFNPLLAGQGRKQVFYKYINAYGCSDSASAGIHVLPAPVFSCPGMLTDVRDGNQYATFRLSNGRCWMAENLAHGSVLDDEKPQTDNCTRERYFPSGYQWNELMQYNPVPGSQGLCPPGWHVPVSAEWEELISFFSGPGQAAGPLKDTTLTHGFRSLQTGFLYQNDHWAFTTGPYPGSMYWTSTPAGNDHAEARGMNVAHNSVSRYESSGNNAFGVRCVRD